MEPDSKINCCQMNAIPWKWKFLLEEYHQIRLNHWKISLSDEVGFALLQVLINRKLPCREINQSCFLQYFDMGQCYVCRGCSKFMTLGSILNLKAFATYENLPGK